MVGTAGDATAPQAPLSQVLHWGIGDVGTKDVMLASAGGGESLYLLYLLFFLKRHSYDTCLAGVNPYCAPVSSARPSTATILAYGVSVEKSAARQALVSFIFILHLSKLN